MIWQLAFSSSWRCWVGLRSGFCAGHSNWENLALFTCWNCWHKVGSPLVSKYPCCCREIYLYWNEAPNQEKYEDRSLDILLADGHAIILYFLHSYAKNLKFTSWVSYSSFSFGFSYAVGFGKHKICGENLQPSSKIELKSHKRDS